MWITVTFIVILLLITVFIKKISFKKEENEKYVDLFDIPFYGGIEELTPYLNQSKQMNVKELTDSFSVNNKYIRILYEQNEEKV